MKLLLVIKNHLWWIATVIGLACLIAVARSITPTADALESPPPQPYPIVTPIRYEPLVNSALEHYTPLENFAPLHTAQAIRYQTLGDPLPEKLRRAGYDTNTMVKTADPRLRLSAKTVHVVTSGEILASIALNYGVTSESIMVLNNLKATSKLRPGQQLLIPENPAQKSTYFHQISANDTLLSIAAKYNSSVADIREANPNLATEALIVDQLIKIPVVFSLQSTPTLTPTETNSRSHVVNAGDTLSQIANEYGVSIEMLAAVNDMSNLNTLRVGTTLKIPATDNLSIGVPIVLHEVKSGETLLGIVSRYGSSVKEVLYSNQDLVPSALEAGQVVAIPIIFPPQKPKITPNHVETPRPAGIAILAEEMVTVLNEQRTAYNLPLFEWDESLSMVAIEHAQDMVVRHYFGHVSPDGRTLRDRLSDHGFSADLKAGENIQRNSQPANRAVEVAVDWLMSSPPHRKNILHRQYTHIGIAIVEAGGLYTIVMDFSE